MGSTATPIAVTERGKICHQSLIKPFWNQPERCAIDCQPRFLCGELGRPFCAVPPVSRCVKILHHITTTMTSISRVHISHMQTHALYRSNLMDILSPRPTRCNRRPAKMPQKPGRRSFESCQWPARGSNAMGSARAVACDCCRPCAVYPDSGVFAILTRISHISIEPALAASSGNALLDCCLA